MDVASIQKGYAPVHPTCRPSSVTDVDSAMKEMDKIYGTSFYGWVKSESNIGYVCMYKRTLFEHYLKSDPATLALVLEWLTADWAVASTAEFLLKLFYTFRIESRQFCSVLAAMSKNWAISRKRDIVNVLLIGETPVTAAMFIRNYTESDGVKDDKGNNVPLIPWNTSAVLDLVRSVATLLRWNDVFMMDFITEYATLLFPDHVKKAAIVVSVIEKYEALCQPTESIDDDALAFAPMSRTSSDSTILNDFDPDGDGTPLERRSRQTDCRAPTKFRTMRESIEFGVEVFSSVLEVAANARNEDEATTCMISRLSLNGQFSKSTLTEDSNNWRSEE